MKIEKRLFGTTKDGQLVHSYTLGRPGGLQAEFLTYGGILRSLWVPAPEGARDVALGFDTVADYEQQDKYYGALVGRVSNRIGGARFCLAGQEYQLAANNGPNCLHGGACGFDRRLWQARIEAEELVLSRLSPDGEEGFPGNLQVEVHCRVTADNGLILKFCAWSDRDTPVSLTSHGYFNLARDKSVGIGEHRLQVFAEAITALDDTSVPTGQLLAVAGTPFDFRQPRRIFEALAGDHPQLRLGAGLDHNYVLKKDGDARLQLAAVLQADGLGLECLTTQPGLQVYSANYLAGERGKNGAVYQARAGICLEAQNWPDAVHQAHFPSAIVKPGQIYQQTTVYRFTGCCSPSAPV